MNSLRNPRAEATSLLPPGHEARVLEPSPPANTDPTWLADDPTDPGNATGTVVTPIPGEGVTWEELGRADPSLADYARSHWLGPFRRLNPLPPGFDSTRRTLHQVAYFVVAPARHAANGKIGLRYTHRGFGTPFFGGSRQLRVEDGVIVSQKEVVDSLPITTLSHACEVFDLPYRETWFEKGFKDPPTPIGPDESLGVDEESATAIGEWFGFGASVLEQARRTAGAVEVSRVQLWPEHFDLAIEMGLPTSKASYGASPGDDHHPEPYLYISAWGAVDRSNAFWNDKHFNGASLPYRQLLEAEDQRATALAFLAEGHRILNA